MPGADLDVRQLELTPVTYPFAIRVSGRVTTGSEQEREDILMLRHIAEKVRSVVQRSKYTRSVRPDWAGESLILHMNIQEDRASMSGITNADIALSSSTAISGTPLATLRQGDKEIPILVQLCLDQRGQLQDVENLYVFAADSDICVPPRQVAMVDIQSLCREFTVWKNSALSRCLPTPMPGL